MLIDKVSASQKLSDFYVKQQQPYSFKKRYATMRAREFAEECDKRGLNYHVSVGGLDSITLFLFLKSIHIDAPGISVSYLEDTSIQKVHKQLGIESLKPLVKEYTENGVPIYWTKERVIQEYGFPILSKETAAKICALQNPTEKNRTVRHAIISGETGEYGGFQQNSRMRLSNKWLQLFAGADPEGAALGYQAAPFKVSDRCCYYLKERPCELWAKTHNSVPYLGLMASEGGRRAKNLAFHGCNYFGKSSIRSAPFAIFQRQDLLQLALELDVPVPQIYGEIIQDSDGTLRTTKAQRTGCYLCGFGVHLEKHPNRFERLKDENPQLYNHCMNHLACKEDGSWYGWKEVLTYIGCMRKETDQ